MTLLRCRARVWRGRALALAAALLVIAPAVQLTPAAADHKADPDRARAERPRPPSAAPHRIAAACTTSAQALRYIVLFDPGTKRGQAERAVSRVCGEQSVYYPEIAVGVANSADPGFATRLGPARAFSAQATYRDSGEYLSRPRVRPTDREAFTELDHPADQWGSRLVGSTSGEESAGRDDVLVGVLDSGIDPAHPDLTDAVDRESSAGCLTGAPVRARRAWIPTTSAHGTHVAGTIAAADDDAGITGLAPGVRVASVKVIDDRGRVSPEAAVCGLMWAAKHRMAVTNSSYYVDPWSSACTVRDGFGVVREAIRRAARFATDSGTLNVAAASNDGANLAPSPAGSADAGGGCEALPASLRGSVVTVSSVDHERIKAGYSSYGLGVIEVAAPGGDGERCLVSTVPGGYADLCGTSMAASHVSGVVALLKAAAPDAGPAELRQTLTATATRTACPADYDLAGNGRQDAFCTGYRAYNGFYGHGVVDAVAALAAVRPADDATESPDPDAKASHLRDRKPAEGDRPGAGEAGSGAKPPRITALLEKLTRNLGLFGR